MEIEYHLEKKYSKYFRNPTWVSYLPRNSNCIKHLDQTAIVLIGKDIWLCKICRNKLLRKLSEETQWIK